MWEKESAVKKEQCMVKISIISGFLGAGKSTFIKKLLQENFFGTAPILVENDFGHLGIDSLVLENSGVQVHEITSGCICCSLIGNFILALEDLIQKHQPEHIIIEPSGVGKLSEILEALEDLEVPFEKHLILTIVDAKRFYYNYTYVNEYFWDQISHADAVVLSKTGHLSAKKIAEPCNIIHAKLPDLDVITSSWSDNFTDLLNELFSKKEQLQSQKALTKTSQQDSQPAEMLKQQMPLSQTVEMATKATNSSTSKRISMHMLPMQKAQKTQKVQKFSGAPNAQTQFESWSTETCLEYSTQRIEEIFNALNHNNKYGTIIRAKGILKNPQGAVLVDYVEGEGTLSSIVPEENGRILVIGTNLNRPALERLFLT